MYVAFADRQRTPCRHCRHMESVDPQTSIASCGLPDGPKCLVTARDGCLRWEREPGIGDDDWNPKPPPFVHAPVPRPRNVSRDGWWTESQRPRRPAPPPKVIPILEPKRDPFGGMFNWDED
jgi:hypothetical protein